MHHKRFALELAGRLGAPILAATLVGCMLQGSVGIRHAALMLTGLCLAALDHWATHHRPAPGAEPVSRSGDSA